MRLFLAVTLPDDVRGAIARATAPARDAAPGVRWVKPELLHLTVKFLGERPDGDERRVAEALRPVLAGARGCDVTIRGAGAFPNFRRPRVVWLAMHPAAALAAIAREVDATLVPLGIDADARPFRAHLTLGRVGDALGVPQTLALAHALNAVRGAWDFRVRDVALVHSTLGRGGPTYRILERLPLGSPGAS